MGCLRKKKKEHAKRSSKSVMKETVLLSTRQWQPLFSDIHEEPQHLQILVVLSVTAFTWELFIQSYVISSKSCYDGGVPSVSKPFFHNVFWRVKYTIVWAGGWPVVKAQWPEHSQPWVQLPVTADHFPISPHDIKRCIFNLHRLISAYAYFQNCKEICT